MSFLFVSNCKSALLFEPSNVMISLPIIEWNVLSSILKLIIGFSKVRGFGVSFHAPISFSRYEMKSGVIWISASVISCCEFWAPGDIALPVIENPERGFDKSIFWFDERNE